jgi:hypothetical protein
VRLCGTAMALHPHRVKNTARCRAGGDIRAASRRIGLTAPVGLPILRRMHGLGGELEHGVTEQDRRLIPADLEQGHGPRDAIMLRAAAHPVGTAIAPHPAQGRGMLSVACLPQPQEEECPQEEQEALSRRHAEIPGLSRSSAGRDPSLKPLGYVHHPLASFTGLRDTVAVRKVSCAARLFLVLYPLYCTPCRNGNGMRPGPLLL